MDKVCFVIELVFLFCCQNTLYIRSFYVDTVPNPCLSASTAQEQYYPFALSTQAFIQCNGDMFYVQPCAYGLYWNQEAKVCDRLEMLSGLTARDPLQVLYGSEQQMVYPSSTSTITDQA
mgnify:CR=1 FL=1